MILYEHLINSFWFSSLKSHLIHIIHDGVVRFVEGFQFTQGVVQVLFLSASTLVKLGELLTKTVHLIE